MTGLKAAAKEKSVILIQDTFTTHYDAEVVLAHYDLLVGLGYTVYVAPYRANGKPLHVKGFLDRFESLARDNDAYYSEIAACGIDMVGIEAAVTLMFRQEYDQRLTNRPAYTIHQFHEWLYAHREGIPKIGAGQCYHLFAHCTEKTAMPQTSKQWQQIYDAFGLDLHTIPTGCCGMSGMFGHEAENEETSQQLYDMSWKAAAEAAGPEKMLATGFSCRCQTKRYGSFVPKHPVEVLNALLKG